MKRYQNRTRWLGLALACGLVTFAITTQAAKPPKPPPPPSPAYVPVDLGGLRASDGMIHLYAADINNPGQVVGYTAISGYNSGYYSQAFLHQPNGT